MSKLLTKKMFLLPFLAAIFFLCTAEDGCGNSTPTTNDIERVNQEKVTKAAAQAVGMPNIKNFREKWFLHDSYELRDQKGLVTYTYVFSQMQACFVYMGPTAGYPIPYATQYSAPQKIEEYRSQVGYAILPQAEPSGLYPPASADATWILTKEPSENGQNRVTSSQAGYMEEKINAFPYKLPERLLCANSKGQ